LKVGIITDHSGRLTPAGTGAIRGTVPPLVGFLGFAAIETLYLTIGSDVGISLSDEQLPNLSSSAGSAAAAQADAVFNGRAAQALRHPSGSAPIRQRLIDPVAVGIEA
jgi:hypothetical protein